jgi:hypothetical protein
MAFTPFASQTVIGNSMNQNLSESLVVLVRYSEAKALMERLQ